MLCIVLVQLPVIRCYCSTSNFFFRTVPVISNFNARMLIPSSIIVSWATSNSSITDNYTVLYTRLCDNIRETLFIDDGSSTGTIIDSLYSGLQYSVHVIAANLLGRTIERAVNVTLEGTGRSLFY